MYILFNLEGDEFRLDWKIRGWSRDRPDPVGFLKASIEQMPHVKWCQTMIVKVEHHWSPLEGHGWQDGWVCDDCRLPDDDGE